MGWQVQDGGAQDLTKRGYDYEFGRKLLKLREGFAFESWRLKNGDAKVQGGGFYGGREHLSAAPRLAVRLGENPDQIDRGGQAPEDGHGELRGAHEDGTGWHGGILAYGLRD